MPVIPHIPIPQARLFSLQSSIAGSPSCQGPLRLLRKIFLSGPAEERIYRIILARTGRQSLGQKK